jgi:hypothetical protein
MRHYPKVSGRGWIRCASSQVLRRCGKPAKPSLTASPIGLVRSTTRHYASRYQHASLKLVTRASVCGLALRPNRTAGHRRGPAFGRARTNVQRQGVFSANRGFNACPFIRTMAWKVSGSSGQVLGEPVQAGTPFSVMTYTHPSGGRTCARVIVSTRHASGLTCWYVC